MAKAESSYGSELEQRLAHAGEGMVMFVQRSLWETLCIQAEAEGCGPGDILNKSVRRYLEEHGSQEVSDYLFALAGQPVAQAGDR